MALKTAFLFIALHLRKSRYYLIIPTFIDIFAAESNPSQSERATKNSGVFEKLIFKTTDCGLQTTEGDRKGNVTMPCYKSKCIF